MERGSIIRTLIKDAITLVLFYFLMRIWWGNESWFTDKVKELGFFLCVGFFFFIMSIFKSLITRPVAVIVTQENKHFRENKTNFSIKGKRKTQEHEREVEFNVIISRNSSVWGWLALKIVNKFNLILLIEPSSPGVLVEADKAPLRNDISETTTGFTLNLSSYLSSIISNVNSGVFSKGCLYIIHEDRVNMVTNETLAITPRLIQSNMKNIPWFITCLIKFDNSKSIHMVNFKWD
ncbi:hypothetical protein [Paenibacillus sp. VMFN-D1]|uniref:hypothetical protein n=1 Tax=Paenibacillus sp. VMFN-D1 TaxID=2135608 RepID=UPI000E24EE4D|nr:hypothetical protein [Paenibacillus sp. VMFN-D1]RED34659.1 hypothetical protein C7820_4322 [Paenibacillus sp. VMFN-D1]